MGCPARTIRRARFHGRPLQRRRPARVFSTPRAESTKPTAASEKDGSPQQQSLDCVGEGQNVICSVSKEDSENSTSGTSRTGTVQEVPSDAGVVPQALSLLFLISPFFFWGTAMVAMKVVAPHSTPLFTASVRLIPAGAVVVAWAALKGKPQPSTTAAWLACLAFGIVDGTMFQGFLAEGLQRVPAGVGSVIIDSQPLTVAVVAALLFGESITPVGVFGLLFGVAGLLLLELPDAQLQALYALDFGANTASHGWQHAQRAIPVLSVCMLLTCSIVG
jgi:multidrug transporter EmrE-like cation transporter